MILKTFLQFAILIMTTIYGIINEAWNKKLISIFLKFTGITRFERNIAKIENIANYANKTFTVAISPPSIPFVNYSTPTTSETIYSGIIIEMLKEIESVLHCRFQIVPAAAFGIESNGSWSGLIGMVYRQEVDFAAASLTMTYQRNTAIDFSSSFYFETIGILIRRPTKPETPFKLLLVFQTSVWVTIVGAMTGTTVILFALGRFVSAKKSIATCETFYGCFWCIYRFITMQASAIEVTNWPNRIFQLFARICIVLLVATYSGSLIATLSASRIHAPFKDLKGLAEAVDNGQFKICVVANTAFYASLMQSNLPEYKILKKFLSKHPDNLPDQKFMCDRKLLDDDNVAYIQEVTYLQNLQARSCQIYPTYLLSERIFPGYFGFAFPKTSSLNRVISQIISEIVERGWISYWAIKHGEKPKFCQLQSDDVYHADIKSLNLLDVGIAFITLAISAPLSFALFFMEKRRLLLKRKNENLIITLPNHQKISMDPYERKYSVTVIENT